MQKKCGCTSEEDENMDVEFRSGGLLKKAASYIIEMKPGSCDSSAGIVTRIGACDFISGGNMRFLSSPLGQGRLCKPLCLLTNRYRWISPWGKLAGASS
jgi:hypothetical protein